MDWIFSIFPLVLQSSTDPKLSESRNFMLDVNPNNLRFFYGTTPQACPYLPNRLEAKAVTELKGQDPSTLHNSLSQTGFRRSHSLAYKPACPTCDACIPARVRVQDFKPTKSMRRIIRKNSQLVIMEKEPIATEEQFLLFQKYEQVRHANGEMALMNFNDFQSMIEDSPIKTTVTEYRTKNGELLAAGLVDELGDGLSGVYTYFSTNHDRLSLGTFLILSLISKTRSLKLPYFYLGYWIKGSPKMAYKGRFLPMEILTRTGWTDHSPKT